VALIALLLLPAIARADSFPALGVNDLRSDGILLPNASYDGAGDLDMLSATGVRLYRGRMRLDCVDPHQTGRFDFSRGQSCGGVDYAALIGALARRGITYLPVLINFSTLSGVTAHPVPPTADGVMGTPTRAEFAAFAAAAARRYGPGGSFWATCGCPSRPIQAWEVWNEENNSWWWGGRAWAEDYAAVFAATRAALRSADPQARAVVGGMTYDPNGIESFVNPDTMIAALTATNSNAFDAVAVHPYSDARGQTAEQIAASAQAYVDLTAQSISAHAGPGPNGAPRQQVWVTEMGWADTDAAPDTIAGALSSFLSGLDAGRRIADSVGPVLWYMLRDGAWKGSRDDQLGMRLTAANGADAGAKPVWNVFASIAAGRGDVGLGPALVDAPAYVPPPAPAPVAPAAPVARATAPAPAAKAAPRVTKVVAVRVRTTRTGVRLLVTCLRARATCKGSAKLNAVIAVSAKAKRRARTKTVGKRSWKAKGGRTTTLRVKLNRAGAKALRRGGRLRVKVVVRARDTRGASAQVSAAATLRHKRPRR
jgi:hypothetical protein